MLCLKSFSDENQTVRRGFSRIVVFAVVIAGIDCWNSSRAIATHLIYPDELASYTATDATLALQQAINMNPDTIILRKNSPWLIDSQITIIGKNNIDIIFEEGAVIEAKAGGFTGTTENMFWIQDSSNISLTSSGAGATIKMRKADYQDPNQYTASEFRHAVGIRGGQNITLSNLEIRDTGGDGIYITGGTSQLYSENITIQNVLVDNGIRNGMSVISVDGLLVEDSQFNNTAGPDLGAGIDFEPNSPNQQLVDILIRNVELRDNQFRAFTVSTSNLTSSSAPISIRVENATMSGGDNGIFITGPDTYRTGSIIFDEGTIENTRLAGINAVNASVLDASGRFTMETSIRNIQMKNVATETNGDELAYPIVFNDLLNKKSGGIDFINVSIDDDRNRPYLYATAAAQVSGAADIQGDFIINNPNGTQWNLGSNLTNIRTVDSYLPVSPFSVVTILKTGFEARPST